MNIAILIPSLSGGGAERVAAIIGQYYSERGDNIYYFVGNSGLPKRYDVKGRIINTGIHNFFDSMADSLISLVRSAHIMREYKQRYHINAALSFMEEYNFINVLSKGTECVICSQCTIPSLRPELTGLLYNKYVVGKVYNQADYIVALSSYSVRELVEECHVKRKKIVKIPNPVIIETTDHSEKEWAYGEHTVLCVGRYVEVKQQDIAIKAFSRVVERVADAKMIICGEGPQKRYLENLIKKLHLQEKVYLLGFQNDIAFFYEHAKVFLLTSANEAFGNVIVEAMAAGLPIISFNAPGGPLEILGCKNKVVDKTEYAEYGIVTPLMYSNKGFTVTEQEAKLGDVIADVLMDERMLNYYTTRSKTRARHYAYKKIMKKWDVLIER